MARPIKFRQVIIPRVKIVNRCMLCGRVISSNEAICSSCSNRNRFITVRGSGRARGTVRRRL